MFSKPFALFTLSALVLSGCTMISELPPAQVQAPGAPSVVPVLLLPETLPAPVPASTPVPAATPAPAAPVTPSAACGVGPGGGSGRSCPRHSESYLREVERAIDDLVREEPSLFDQRRTRGCGNCYQVLNPTRYVQRLTEMVARQGLCAHYDGEELAVKANNGFNDQYDILTSDMYIRRQGGSYRSTCYPAWF
jgi:hypothetical protein